MKIIKSIDEQQQNSQQVTQLEHQKVHLHYFKEKILDER